MQWISVNERLPEPDTWVLVWAGGYHWIAMFRSMYGIWEFDHEDEEYQDTPTHWMPLPEAPSVEGEG